MRSSKLLELSDLERDLPTTAEDVIALRRARSMSQRMDLEAYLEFLAALDQAPVKALRARGTHEGAEPFEL